MVEDDADDSEDDLDGADPLAGNDDATVRKRAIRDVGPEFVEAVRFIAFLSRLFPPFLLLSYIAGPKEVRGSY